MEAEKIIIKQVYIDQAKDYAIKSSSYLAKRHDFRGNSLQDKQAAMYYGKLGEKGFQSWLDINNVIYQEDKSHHTVGDKYDFIFPEGTTADVKTRTKPYHTRTLEMVEQINKNPKSIYISARLNTDLTVDLVGWCTRQDFLKVNRIENQGYLDNFVLFDNELRLMSNLLHIFKLKNYIKGFQYGKSKTI